MKTRIAAVLVLAVVAIAGAAGGWFYRAMWCGGPSRETAFEIEAGEPARLVLENLEREGVVPSALAARLYLRGWGRGRELHYGRFVFKSGVRPVDVVERILDGRVEMLTVTIVEGSDASVIGETFVAAGVGTPEDWHLITDNTSWVSDIAPDAPSLEGFFFPDTYRFAIGTSAEHAARYLVDRFLDVWRQERGDPTTLWASPLEIVTLASMVEAETSIQSERGQIAGVFRNRLLRGMLLQCDPTVVYSLKRHGQWNGRLLRIHWQFDDPYNTYRFAGLPPGPINSPGRAALAAALDPAVTNSLYFVARPGGGHTFSETLADHNRAVADLLRSRR